MRTCTGGARPVVARARAPVCPSMATPLVHMATHGSVTVGFTKTTILTQVVHIATHGSVTVGFTKTTILIMNTQVVHIATHGSVTVGVNVSVVQWYIDLEGGRV